MRKLIDIDHERTMLRIFILFIQTAREMLKYTDTHLQREAGISTTQLIVLRSLATNEGLMQPSEIAEWTQTERHNITALMRRMSREGLIISKRSGKDTRYVDVVLTDRGRQVLTEAMPVATEIVNQAMLSISEGDAIPLENSLRVLRHNAHDGLEHLARRAQP